MLGDTVGAVYVKVLADTSSLKQEIEDDAGEMGEVFGEEFQDGLQKKLNKIQFGKVLDKRLEKEAKRLAKKIQRAQIDGEVDFTISAKFRDEIEHLSELFDVPLSEVEKMVERRLAGSFSRALDTMGRDVKKRKATLGDALGDVFKDMSFDAAIDNMVKGVVNSLPDAVKQSIEKGERNVHHTFASDINPELKRLAREWGFTVEELAAEVKRRIPAAYRQAAKEAEKSAKGLGKATTRSLLDALDDVNFRDVAERAAADFKKHLTPAMREALRKGQQVDFTWDDEARKELRRLAKSMNVSVGDMSKVINRLMHEAFRDIEKPIGKFETSMTKVRNSLRRAGTGGWFDNLTNAMSALLGVFYAFSKGVTKMTLRAGELLGDMFDKLGSKITNLASKGGRLSGFASKLGPAFQKAGAAISALFSNPITGAIAAVAAILGGLGMLSRVLGMVTTLVVDLAGMFSMLATAVVAAVAAMAVLVPIVVSLGSGLVGLVIGAVDATKALVTWNKAMNESDPKKKAELLKKYNEQMKALGPNARAAVEAVKPLFKEFAGLRKAAGESLFEGMAKSIKGATPLITVLKDGIVGVAGAIGDVIDYALDLAKSFAFVRNWQALWVSAEKVIKDVGYALVDIFAGLTAFFSAIIPQTEEFTGKIRDIGGSFRKWAESDAGRESIKQWFTDAWALAKNLWDVIDSLGAVLGTFFTALMNGPEGAETGGFLTTIADKLDALKLKIEEWDKSGKLDKWLSDAKTTAHELWLALSALAGMFASLNSDRNREWLHYLLQGITFVINALKVMMTVGSYAFVVLMTPISGVIALVKLLWQSIMLIPKAWKATQDAFNTFKAAVGRGVDWLVEKVNSVKRALSGWRWPSPPSWFSNLGNGIRGFFPGAAAGGLFTSPTHRLIGEAGREAVIPLDRPLSLVDPSVRGMAAQLRGKGSVTSMSSVRREVTNNWNISSPTGDPYAIAAQVMNREVAMAG